MYEEEEFQDVNLDEYLSDDMGGQENDDLDFLTAEEKALLAKIEKKQAEQDYIIQTFHQLETRPSEEEIENLKAQVGEVFLASFGEKENFLFRSLKRMEWRALIQKIQKLDELKKSEVIVMKACLWPKMDQQNINVLSAGAVETLKDLILQASNFMGPDMALQLVRKL